MLAGLEEWKMPLRNVYARASAWIAPDARLAPPHREGAEAPQLSLSETLSELDHVGRSGNLMPNDRLPEAGNVLPDLDAQVEGTP
jgi:hypothetical protein